MQTIFNCEQQEYENWCWAAVSASVYDYLYPHARMKQCEVASKVLSNECCVQPLPDPLNAAASLEDAFQSIHVAQSLQGEPIAFQEVRAHLDNALPVCVRIQWRGQDRGHFVIIIGYGVAKSGEEWIDLADPFFGYMCVPYSWFRNSYQEIGRWDESFLIHAPVRPTP